MRMSNITQLSAAQLQHAAEVQTKVEALQAELAKVLGGTSSPGKVRTARRKAPRKKRKLSAAGRAKIIAATKAYWAKVRAGAKPAKAKAPAKRKKLSAAARAKLAAIAKARWAKIKAAGKNRL